jgi:hypothetical protein
MRYLMIGALIALTGCGEKASDKATAEMAIIEKSGGDPGQLCQVKRKIAEAYLAEQDQREYESADLSAKIACRRASQQGY